MTEARPDYGAAIDRALRDDLDTEFLGRAIVLARQRSNLLCADDAEARVESGVTDNLEVFLARTRNAYNNLIGSGRRDRRMAEVYASLAARSSSLASADETWALTKVLGGRTIADWLNDSGSVVHRGPRAEVASFARFPKRGTDIYLGVTARRAPGLALLHEGVHAIHHDLLYRYSDDLHAAFPDPLWLESVAHLAELATPAEFRFYVAARTLVLARVHAVRALYAINTLWESPAPDVADIQNALRCLYSEHLGALPPPCDAVTDLFLIDQNIVRVRAMAFGALHATTALGAAFTNAGSQSALFDALQTIASHLVDDGWNALADEGLARSFECGARWGAIA